MSDILPVLMIFLCPSGHYCQTDANPVSRYDGRIAEYIHYEPMPDWKTCFESAQTATISNPDRRTSGAIVVACVGKPSTPNVEAKQ